MVVSALSWCVLINSFNSAVVRVAIPNLVVDICFCFSAVGAGIEPAHMPNPDHSITTGQTDQCYTGSTNKQYRQRW